MDFATLKAFKPSEYEGAADGYRAMGDSAERAKDAVDNRIAAGIRHQLEGATATAALGQLKQLARNLHYLQTECGLASTALNGFAFDIEAAKRKLKAAIEDAHAANCTVTSDGSVSYPAGGDKVDGKVPEGGTVEGSPGPWDPSSAAVRRQSINIHPNPNYGKALGFADRIADALQEATEADAKWAPKLRKLRADDDLTVSAADWVDAQKDTGGVREGAEHYLDGIKAPPKGGDPEDNAEWWKHLSADEREAYISLHPASIGAMNGLPAVVRDEANRTVLAETRGQYEMKLNAIPKEPSPQFVPIGARGDMTYNQEWLDWHDKYSERKEYLEEKLKGMRAIQDRFDRTGENGLPEAYLLGFDPDGEGNGRIILANGNPDTADHTGIYIPGTKTDISTIGEDSGDTPSDLKRSENLWNESRRLAPGQKISTITWLDYDAPDNILLEATNDRYAEKGAPILHDFLEGNRKAHQYASGDTGHTTVIGHSYGSTLIGDSAKTASWNETPIPADDVLVAGSPGMQANHAADLGIDPKHMWAMGGGGSDFIVRHGGEGSGLGDNWIIPTDPEFGGNIMTSDAGDHGAFWDAEGGQASLSLKNQSRVVVGRYGDVTLDSKAHW
ncbi:alpha/beta hydrolase [Streptomyces chattanoogensis]|uniref:DUF1023 domain-containing protein n=1 Tax=Streptomyces chattanoogensis TaxID=66876 RepID=A0A0N0XV62_9ACTN|nr:alpha/beta hydrolase [Streptomyces chattanoogensis]KPC61316.1 hypothetical protein ADL29_24920 [Streptomyces chattanoogensis]